MCPLIIGGIMAGVSAIGTATAAAGTAVGATMAAGATALGVGAGAAATTGAVAAGLTTGALNGALIGTATGAIAGAATGKGAGKGALLGAATGAAGGALVSGAGMAINGTGAGQWAAAEGTAGKNPLDWTVTARGAGGTDITSPAISAGNDLPTTTVMNGEKFQLVSDSTGEHWVPMKEATTVMNGEKFQLVSDSTGEHWVPMKEAAQVQEAAPAAAGKGAAASAEVDWKELASAGMKAAGQGVSSGVQGYAAMEQGKADAAALKEQAKLKEQQARTELENAEFAKRDRMRQFRQMRGQGRAQAAANGMLVEGDNVATWEQDLAAEAAYDSWKIGENARRTAWGYRQEAGVMGRQARQARRTGNLKAAGAWISAPFQMFSAGAPLLA